MDTDVNTFDWGLDDIPPVPRATPDWLCKEGVARIQRKNVSDIYLVRHWDLMGEYQYCAAYAVDDLTYTQTTQSCDDPMILHKTDKIEFLGLENNIIEKMPATFRSQVNTELPPQECGVLPCIRAWIKIVEQEMDPETAIAWAKADFWRRRPQRIALGM